jgi:uncharacterized protein YbaR (Trm112 family)
MPAPNPEVLELLRCPHCVAQARESGQGAGRLTLFKDVWLIADCTRKYPIREGIPVMLAEEGEKWMEVEPENLPTWPAEG